MLTLLKVIDPNNFRPFHFYKPHIIEHDDLEDLLKCGYLRVIVSIAYSIIRRLTNICLVHGRKRENAPCACIDVVLSPLPQKARCM